MNKITFEITPEGNLRGLYTDEIDLFGIGQVTNVHKASNVEFNEEAQMWEVLSLDGEILHADPNRENAIEWEIEMFSPGGEHYNGE